MRLPQHLIEFPADDPDRARCFWIGAHERGNAPGDTLSLPYLEMHDPEAALRRVHGLGGEVIHPGAGWVVCRDSAGSPSGLPARKA